jgi:hypothetical protein
VNGGTHLMSKKIQNPLSAVLWSHMKSRMSEGRHARVSHTIFFMAPQLIDRSPAAVVFCGENKDISSERGKTLTHESL